MSASLRIAVVGAGIGGVTAALCLAAQGHQVEVFEQADTAAEAGAGLQIGPNGMHVLTALGLAPKLRAVATAPEALEMRDGLGGRRIARIPLGATAELRYGAPYLQFHRADLLEVLLDAARDAGVGFRFGVRVDPAAPPEAQALIAADGVRSGFRARLVPDAVPVFTGQVAWRALIPSAAAPFDPSLTRLYLGPGRHVVVYPLRDGASWNVVAVEERTAWTAEGWHTAADPESLRTAFDGWAPELRHLLDAVQSGWLWGLFSHRPLPRWQDGHVALLGDACHPMLPFLAQGATMAIEDAWVLADRLSSGQSVPQALSAYEAARKSRATRVQQAAARNAHVYHLRPRALRAARDAGLAAAARLAPGGLLGGFDWLYGGNVTRGGAAPRTPLVHGTRS